MTTASNRFTPRYIEIEIGSSHGITLTSARAMLSPRSHLQNSGAPLNKLLSPPSRPCVFVVTPHSGEYTQETEEEFNTRF